MKDLIIVRSVVKSLRKVRTNMADIELVIKIPKEVYEDIKDSNIIFRDDERTCYEAVQNGIPLPKGHSRLIAESEDKE